MTKGPLGPDEVVVTSFAGREAISRPFSFEIEFISTRLDLKPGEIIGADVSIEIDRRDRNAQPLPPRYFHGYVSRFAAGDAVVKDSGLHKYRQYRAEVVPWLWFLTQTARCYLFFPEKDEKSILEVIEAVINRAKSDLHVDPVSDLGGIGGLSSRKVKHCVQYRETDFNFLSRTMEKYGVFYYFRFEDGKHTLVLDMKKNYPVCEEAEVSYPRISGGQPTGDHITQWQHDYEFVSGKWSHTDYNFETPSTALGTSAPKLPAVDVAQSHKYEIYDYPGGYAKKPEGEADARVRQEEREVSHNSVEGTSTCRTFTPGHKFKLMAHPDDDVASEQGKSYVLTSVQHAASQPTDDTGDSGSRSYSNRFTCILDSVQFRPDRRTPWPVIAGVQTAVVVGPAGSELYTDPQARVKVQFHWDRVGNKDQNTSCWIRVAQTWAGKGWGSVSTPRIGHEVIVEFLEGDPDQPIVTGSVHNADNKPPHTGVVSGLKSNTHKGSGHNAMTMDDTAGKEKITIHAQYDMNTTVLHDQTSEIKNNRTGHVIVDDTLNVDANRTMHVKGKLAETIDTGQETTIAAGFTETITGGETSTITGGRTSTINGTWDNTVNGHLKEAVTSGAEQDVTGDCKITVSGNIDQSAGAKIDIHATGAGTYTSDASLKLAVAGSVIEIMPSGITITFGGSSVKVDAAGVSVMGPKISLN